MIEPEIAFAGLGDNAALAEAPLKYLFPASLRECLLTSRFVALTATAWFAS